MLSDSPATLSTPYTSPPPPAPLHQVGEPLPLMPQFFSPSPLLQPTAAQFGPVNPATCAAVRYTAVPISPSAMFPYLTAGGGDPHKQPQALYCNQAPIEVSIYNKIHSLYFKFKFGHLILDLDHLNKVDKQH